MHYHGDKIGPPDRRVQCGFEAPGESFKVRYSQLWVLAAMVLIAGCGSKKSNQADELAAGGTSRSSETPRRPYVINDAGVRFNPPPSWDVARIDVVSRSGKEAAESHPGAEHIVSFDYKAEQPAHRNSPLVNLYVFRKSSWTGSLGDSLPGAVVDSTGDWVFIVSMPGANPYRRGLLDADQFEAMRLSLDDVREAFSIADGGPADATLRAESGRK